MSTNEVSVAPLQDDVPEWIGTLVGTVEIFSADFDAQAIYDNLNNKQVRTLTKQGNIVLTTLWDIRWDHKKTPRERTYENDIFPINWTDEQCYSHLKSNHNKKWKSTTGSAFGLSNKKKRSRSKLVTTPEK